MEHLIEKNRARLRALTWMQFALFGMLIYLDACKDISVVVPCAIANYNTVSRYVDGRTDLVAIVTVQYRDDFATVEFGEEYTANTTDHYTVGTEIACQIYPYRYNVIGRVFLAHYSHDVSEHTHLFKYTNYDNLHVMLVMITVIGYALVTTGHVMYTLNLTQQREEDRDAFKVGERDHELKMLAINTLWILSVLIYTTGNWWMHQDEPCVIVKYEEVLHDYSGAGLQDIRNFVKVKIDVQVVTPQLYVGTAHVQIYEGPCSNISSIRDYYRIGQTLTCDTYPTRFQIIDKVSVLHHDEDKTKPARVVKPKFDRHLLNIMFSAMATVALFYVGRDFYRIFKQQPVDKDAAKSDGIYKEPIVLNN